MSETAEFSLPVPAELVRKTVGLSMDLGGSMLKFVFRSKENLEEAESTSGNTGHLQLVSFPRTQLNVALEYVKKRALISRTDAGSETPEVITTGVGCTEWGKLLNKAFNIRLKNITEFDCFIQSFHYLSSYLPRKEFLHAFDDDATIEPIAMATEQMAMIMAVQQYTTGMQQAHGAFDMSTALGKVVNESDRPIAESEDMYPCVLAMCGSGNGYMQINKDGSFNMLDASNRGGRAFYGMGRLLTGCKDYDELIELASSGNNKNVDVYNSDLFKISDNVVEGEDSIYTKSAEIENPALIYCFGKAFESTLEDFKREDLARAWLNFLVLDLVQSLSLIVQLNKIKRLFFTGSFCNTALVRAQITTEFARRNLFSSMLQSDKLTVVQFDFVKPGPHLGALGALINGAGLIPSTK